MYCSRAASRVCQSVQCFKDFVQRKNINQDDLKILFESEAHPTFAVLRYLVEELGFDPTIEDLESLDQAAYAGRVETVRYLLKRDDVIDSLEGSDSRAIDYVHGNRNLPRWVKRSNPQEYLKFFQKRFQIFQLLVRHRFYDDLLLEINPTKFYPFLTYDQEINNSLNKLIAKWLKLIIFRPDFNLRIGLVKEAVKGQNSDAYKVLLMDFRMNIDAIKLRIKEIPESEIETIRAEKDALPWTLMRVHTLKDLSVQKKYDLMVDLQAQGKIDSTLQDLLENPKFVEAYLMDDETLASKLEPPVIPHVNHAAAAALYADEIDVFDSLVPFSFQF